MLHLVVVVLNDVTQLEPLMEAWTREGAQGITVLHSTGVGRLKDALRRDDVPLFPSLSDLLEHDDLHHRTLFTVVEGDALVEQLIAAAQAIVGDFDAADTGILFTVPVGRALGLGRRP
jgi:nitrogen regulatory protein P-II 1